MNRRIRWSLLAACLAAAGVAAAQQISAGKPATTTRSDSQVQRVAPAKPPARLDPVAPAATAPLPSRLEQRPQAQPISARGPSQADGQGVVAPPSPAAPARVYDRRGRPMTGMKPAGPNRVLDTRTGRYYNTVPSGDGQRIER